MPAGSLSWVQTAGRHLRLGGGLPGYACGDYGRDVHKRLIHAAGDCSLTRYAAKGDQCNCEPILNHVLSSLTRQCILGSHVPPEEEIFHLRCPLSAASPPPVHITKSQIGNRRIDARSPWTFVLRADMEQLQRDSQEPSPRYGIMPCFSTLTFRRSRTSTIEPRAISTSP